MTINYNLAVSTSKPWTLFSLLFKWKGSIWRAVSVELAVWLILYAALSCIYRFWLDEIGQRRFEVAIAYCDHGLSYIPLNFMLGFFVTAILNRWLTLYRHIGFIDNTGLTTSLYVRGTSEEAVMLRRNIVRYCELAQALIFRDMSMRTRKRFPTIESVMDAGFMLPHEKEAYESVKSSYGRTWLPFQWALDLTYQARKKGFIESDYYQVILEEEIKKFRTNLARLMAYDWVPIPLVYPQLICLAVHTFFLISLVARQYVISAHATSKTDVDIYFPVMGSLQFIFYMGWMKIAEVMLNPFGEDVDDFEGNRVLDRGLSLGLTIVTAGYGTTPEIKKDNMYDNEDTHLYSEESALLPNNRLRESLSHLNVTQAPTKKVKMVPHSEDLVSDDREDSTLRQRLTSISVGELFFFRNAGRMQSTDNQPPSHPPRSTLKRNSLPCAVPSPRIRKFGLTNEGFAEEDEESIAESEESVRKSTSDTNLHHTLSDIIEKKEDKEKPQTSTSHATLPPPTQHQPESTSHFRKNSAPATSITIDKDD